MALLSPANDTRVNLLLLMADLRSGGRGVTQRAGATSGVEAPLFLWEQLASRLGSPADRAMLRNRDSAEQGDAASSELRDPFTVAVQADHLLRPEERDVLVAARAPAPLSDAAASAIANAQNVCRTPAAKEYVLYLQGASAFWHGDYDKAAAVFLSLQDAKPAWVRETAAYMVGRTLTNRAQTGAFDQYGSFAQNWQADSAKVSDSETALDHYLRQYPKGLYAQSARGLKRRGYWLARDTVRLQQEYSELLLMPPEERNVSDVELAQEIDNKLLGVADGDPRQKIPEETLLREVRNPLLLAVLDLRAMRTSEPASTGVSAGKDDGALTLVALQQQKPYFATQMPLFEYLLAIHAFYVEHRPADVLRMLPDAARQTSFTYVQFSRQMLRGLALEATGDRNALAFWTQMLPGATSAYQRPTLELAIAYHEERSGEIREVFASGSPVRYPYLREVLLANVADAGLLRAQAKNTSAPQRERDIALFTLLYKEATRGKPTEFLKDLTLVPASAPTEGYYMLDDDMENSYFVPDGPSPPADIPLGVFLHNKTDARFRCPGLRGSEEQLAKEPAAPTAQLCVADFIRLNAALSNLVSPSTRADDLGGTPSQFPGVDFARMDTYKAVLANAKSSREDKAYALYRAVNCYGPSGNNACGGDDVPLRQRKTWFTTLKHEYAGTYWANAQQYYW